MPRPLDPTAAVIDPPCDKSLACSQPIPGSSWDYANKAQTAQAATQKQLDADPKAAQAAGVKRPALALERAIGNVAPNLLKGLKGIFVNPAIGESAGAQLGDCAGFVPNAKASDKCIEVPNKLEIEAFTYNSTQNPVVGGQDRMLWEANLVRILTHEMAHFNFEQTPPAGLGKMDVITEFELNELNSLLSEFPVLYTYTLKQSKTAEENQKQMRDILKTYITKPGESIGGTIKKMRCLNPCAVVDKLVKTVFDAQAARWTQEQKDFFLSEVTKPGYALNWPQ